MRQLHVHIDKAASATVLSIAREHDAMGIAAMDADRPGATAGTLIILQLPNERVGSFLEAVERAAEGAEFVILPRGTLPLRAPLSGVSDQVQEVTHLSTIELVASALQSIGSWRGMLLYALFSGLVAAYGVMFNVGYLLVAAMLIAPMGAPAMVATVGVALGDTAMVRRGALRFVVAVVILALAALGLGMAQGMEVSTATMELVSSLSIWTVMLSLVGGAAGAQSLVQSDRDSLVTATATGFLVAVSLSPPAAVLGLAVAIGRWDYATQMLFVVALTFVGVLLGGWASLTLFGVRPGDLSAGRGSTGRRTVMLAAAAVLLLAMVGWQSTRSPRFRKADRSRDAVTLARQAVREVPGVALVEVAAHFTRPDAERLGSAEGLVVIVLAERTGTALSTDSLAALVHRAVEARVRTLEDVVPFTDVTVLPGPPPR